MGVDLSSGDVTTSENSGVLLKAAIMPRTLADRAADTVNVKDFQAVGDGYSDDLTYINLALTAGLSNGSIPIDTITWSAGQATATVGSTPGPTSLPYDFGLIAGNVFTIAGAVPSAYNGTFTALSGTTSSTLIFALPVPDPGSATTGGFVIGGGRVVFPFGTRFSTSSAPNWTGANVVELNGATVDLGPSIANGDSKASDLLKTVLSGGEYWIRQASTRQLTPALRIDHNQTMDLPGNVGGLGTILDINGEIQAGSTQTALWGASIQIKVLGNNSGDSVGINTSMVKTAGTKAGVTASNPTVSDQSNGPASISGPMTGEEIDLTGLGLDDGGIYASGDLPDGSGIRTGLMVVGRGMSETIGLGPTEFGWGVRVGAGRFWQNGVAQSTYMKRPFSFHGVYSIAAFDASLGQALSGSNAAAFAMAAGQTFGLDAIPAAAQLGPVHDFTWNSTANEFQLRANQLPYFGINGNTGAVSITGPITGNGFAVDNSGNISGGNLLLAGALSSSVSSVLEVNIVAGGLWTEIPTLTISPSAAGATAEASVSSMVASGGSISIATAGSGYALGDTVTLAGGTGTQPTYTIATVQVTPGFETTANITTYTAGDILYLAAPVYVWTKGYQYSLGAVIRPSLMPPYGSAIGNGSVYTLTGGTPPYESGTSEPDWPSSGTVTDNECVWTEGPQTCGTSTGQVPFFLVLGSVASVMEINSPGFGFMNGDMVALESETVDGVAGTSAQFEVHIESGVLTLLIIDAGLFPANPISPVTLTPMGDSTGSGLIATLVLASTELVLLEPGNLNYLNTGLGPNYPLSGGTSSGMTAPLTFIPTSLALLSSGSMTALPTFPASFDTTTGSGSGLTATVGFAINEVSVSSGGSGYSPVPADVTASSAGLVQPASLTAAMSTASSTPVQISFGLTVTGATTLSAVTATSLNGAIIGGTTAAAATFTTLTAATLTSTGTTTLGPTIASGITGTPIGVTSPNTGKFTTLTSIGITELGPTVADSINDTPIGNAMPDTGKFTTLSASSLDAATIGGITPAPGTFTTLTATGATSLTTLTATGATSLGATTASAINSTPIGNTTPAAGKFTTLLASSLDAATIGGITPAPGTFTTLTATGATSLAALTATGATSLGATTASSINATPIGNTTAAAGKFTTLSASSLDATTIGGITPAPATFTTLTSTGTTSLGATTASSINATPIGNTTAAAGKFTTLSASSLDATTIGGITPAPATFTTLTSTGTTSLGASNAASLDATPIGNTTPSNGTFTTLKASTVASSSSSSVLTVLGALIVDGSVALTAAGNLAAFLLKTPNSPANSLFYSAATAAQWVHDTAYTVGTVVAPVTANGYSYVCITAGTSGTSEPTWPTGANSTVADGGSTPQLVWEINYPYYDNTGIDGPVLRGNSGGVLGSSSGIALQWIDNAVTTNGSLTTNGDLTANSAVTINAGLNLNGRQLLTNRATPSFTTNFTYTVPTGYSIVQFMLSGTISSGTVTFPSSAPDGLVITFTTTFPITTFTLELPEGQTNCYGAPGTLTPGSPCTFIYDSTTLSWLRLS